MAPRWLARAIPLVITLVTAVHPDSLPAAQAPPLAWTDSQEHRLAPLLSPAPTTASPARTRFTELNAADLGIRWTNQISPTRYTTRQNTMNGAGLALADFDGDGWCDLFLCGKEGPSALYRNLGGWRFEDVTSEAGLACTHLLSTGAAVGDVNGDGRPDLHVTSFLGPDALFLNLGGFRFTNVTAAAGLETTGGNTSSAFSDVDGDGDLDLYLCRFGVEAILRDGARITTRMVGGVAVPTGRYARRLKVVDGRIVEFGENDILFLNDGHGVFKAASWPEHFVDENDQPVPESPLDYSLAVQIRDFDGNGEPDLYICSDFQTPDRLWLGQGRGRFKAAPPLSFRSMSSASMGVDAADIDRDGHLDFITVEMLSRDPAMVLAQVPSVPFPSKPRPAERAEVSRNVLQWNRGDGTYAEIAWFAGLAASDWSWTPIFVDVDLDGYQDLLVSNGHPHDLNRRDPAAPSATGGNSPASQILKYPPIRTPNAAWRNTGQLRFEDQAEVWGFDSTRITHGMALADLDNDGDPDVVGNVWRDAPLLVRNESQEPRLAVRLVGADGNTTAAGARVRVLGGPVPNQELELLAGGRYLSSDQPQLTFAARTAPGASLSIAVRWRRGSTSVVHNAELGHLYEIREPSAAPIASPKTTPPASMARAERWFAPCKLASELQHKETTREDFERQPSLPWRLRTSGPALAVGSGPEAATLFVGRAKGDGIVRVRLSEDPDSLPPVVEPVPGTAPLPADVAGLAVVSLAPDSLSLLASLGHVDPGATNRPSALRWDLTSSGWAAAPPLPPLGAVPGPIGAADIDADGDTDVLVAGRCLLHRYPEPAPVVVLTNRSGQLVRDETRSAALARVGLVTGLAVGDVSGDGRPDLVAACEWGSLRVFSFAGPGVSEITEALGLAEWTGLWQCVALADFDGDGHLDIAAGNWGANTSRQRTPQGPWSLWYGEVAADNQIALVEGAVRPGSSGEYPRRPLDVLLRDLPWLRGQFESHDRYARGSIQEILGDRVGRASTMKVRTLDSSLFLHRTPRWERRSLPGPAQWTPVHALDAGDVDQDGDVDLVIGQNHFSARPDDERSDAGVGLVLLNDGRAELREIPPAAAGLDATGEQRAVRVHDVTGDGMPDLVFGEVEGPVRVYRNLKPGGNPRR